MFRQGITDAIKNLEQGNIRKATEKIVRLLKLVEDEDMLLKAAVKDDAFIFGGGFLGNRIYGIRSNLQNALRSLKKRETISGAIPYLKQAEGYTEILLKEVDNLKSIIDRLRKDVRKQI